VDQAEILQEDIMSTHEVYTFSVYRLTPSERLLQDGESAIKLGGRAFDVVTGGLGSSSPEFREVARLVAAGDTLWAIASDASPGNDPRPLVAAIERVNHLHAGDLVPGQALVIPTSA
jgi:hypothetical protein